MNPERWTDIERLYRMALEQAPEKRAEWLAGVPPDVRGEIERLLAEESAGDRSPDNRNMQDLPAGDLIGVEVGPYLIEALLGAGGMGRVYRGRDLKLRRPVAIKALTSEFADDPVRVSRFEREARLLAALNHPNIASVHGLEESHGRSFLVMELVEGETLAQRLKRLGAIPFEEALKIASQVAAAIQAAHEKGIVHRDLKPGNIMVTAEGLVKVLDFGLAKVAASSADDGGTTMTMEATKPGTVIGTPAYMSPEQARGEPVDKRTDIWAFGAILYELLTGTRLFLGGSTAEILGAVFNSTPDLTRAPEPARRLISWCLERDLSRRLRDIGDGMRSLEETALAPTKSEGRLSHAGWIAAALAALVAVGAWVWPRPAAVSGGVVHVYMVPPENAQFATGGPNPLHGISPDGRTLAAVAEAEGASWIWIRPLDSPRWRRLDETEGALGVFWAPDSRNLGFMTTGKIRRVDAETGSARDIMDLTDSRGATWGTGGTILVGTLRQGIVEVSENGGKANPATLVLPGEAFHYYPHFLPDGTHFLYGRAPRGVFVGSVDTPPAEQNDEPILPDFVNASFSGDSAAQGYLLFPRDGTLYSQTFDLERFALLGDEVPIATDVRVGNGQEFAQYSTSRTRTLVTASAPVVEITVVSRNGERKGAIGDPRFYSALHPSPDGRKVLVMVLGPEEEANHLIVDVDTGRAQVIPQAFGAYATWSRNGSDVIINSIIPATWTKLFRANPAGGPAVEIATSGQEPKFVFDWVNDGIVYSEGGSRQRDLFLQPDAPGSAPRRLVSNNFFNYGARVSPNGKWMAYVSDESGTDEVYVQAFPDAAGERTLVSRSGGTMPVWNRSGSELYYAADGQLMAVDVDWAGGAPSFGSPRRLFEIGASPRFRGATYWSPLGEGEEFLVLRPAGGSGRSVHLTFNWSEVLQ